MKRGPYKVLEDLRHVVKAAENCVGGYTITFESELGWKFYLFTKS